MHSWTKVRKRCQATAAVIFGALLLIACDEQLNSDTSTAKAAPYQPQPYVHVVHPEWSKNAVIYQINTRQFTPEGTFNAAAKQLPRLKQLGATILWLMPVQPIGEVNRKGSLGSPYS
ncbi:MAG TPA: hypothetical protein VLA40_05645, partial [Rheinheimera sp.]|nr:hypothetical protein [Rheinheimera sp.]